VRIADAALACLLVACTSKEAAPEQTAAAATGKPAPPGSAKLDTLSMTVPDGWTARFDADDDKWLFESSPLADGRTATAVFERAPRPMAAGPEALRHHLATHAWSAGTKADIASRKGVRDGFAVTFVVHTTRDPELSRREVHIIRELGSEWYRCVSLAVPSEAIERAVLALCTSIKRA
jgi:hypothetical protein